jgi:hypothetical protein
VDAFELAEESPEAKAPTARKQPREQGEQQLEEGAAAEEEQVQEEPQVPQHSDLAASDSDDAGRLPAPPAQHLVQLHPQAPCQRQPHLPLHLPP